MDPRIRDIMKSGLPDYPNRPTEDEERCHFCGTIHPREDMVQDYKGDWYCGFTCKNLEKERNRYEPSVRKAKKPPQHPQNQQGHTPHD